MKTVSPPILFASVNSLHANICQIKEELQLHCRRRTSMLQIDRFAEAMEVNIFKPYHACFFIRAKHQGREQEFLLEAEPVVDNLKAMTKEIEEKLKELIIYYGEDPATIKSEEFFDIIHSFSTSFAVRTLSKWKNSNSLLIYFLIQKAQVEIHEARERALRRQKQQEAMQKVRVPDIMVLYSSIHHLLSLSV